MIILINIDDSDQLEELSTCAMDNDITIEQYASNIVRTWLETRVKESYFDYIKKLDNVELKSLFGDYKSLKK